MEPEVSFDKRATDAIQVNGVSGLQLRNVSVKWVDGKPEEKWRSGLTLKDVNGLEVDGFTARQGLKNGAAAAVALENVADGVLRHLRAADGTGAFLEFRGPVNKDLWTHSNEFSKAAKPMIFTEGAQRKLVRVQ
jgi:hypothetical protein